MNWAQMTLSNQLIVHIFSQFNDAAPVTEKMKACRAVLQPAVGGAAPPGGMRCSPCPMCSPR